MRTCAAYPQFGVAMNDLDSINPTKSCTFEVSCLAPAQCALYAPSKFRQSYTLSVGGHPAHQSVGAACQTNLGMHLTSKACCRPAHAKLARR